MHVIDLGDYGMFSKHGFRPRLLPRYRALQDDDLLTRSILIVMDKPLRGTVARR